MRRIRLILVAPDNNELTAFNNVSNKLAICDLPQTSSEEELTESILELDSVVISYDEQTNKLLDIDVVDI